MVVQANNSNIEILNKDATDVNQGNPSDDGMPPRISNQAVSWSSGKIYSYQGRLQRIVRPERGGWGRPLEDAGFGVSDASL